MVPGGRSRAVPLACATPLVFGPRAARPVPQRAKPASPRPRRRRPCRVPRPRRRRTSEAALGPRRGPSRRVLGLLGSRRPPAARTGRVKAAGRPSATGLESARLTGASRATLPCRRADRACTAAARAQSGCGSDRPSGLSWDCSVAASAPRPLGPRGRAAHRVMEEYVPLVEDWAQGRGVVRLGLGLAAPHRGAHPRNVVVRRSYPHRPSTDSAGPTPVPPCQGSDGLLCVDVGPSGVAGSLL